MECFSVLLTVCPHINCTPRPRTTPTPYRKRKSHHVIMYPPKIIVTTLTVYVKIPRSLHCLMSNATCFYFVGVLYSPVFTCSPRYLCPPRVPISQLTLCYIATNITQQTQTTHRDMRGQLLVWRLYSYNFLPSEPAPSQRDWHLTIHCICVKHAAMFYGQEAKVPLSTVEGNKTRGRPRSPCSSRS